jgi:RNA polymerase sigma-70 factor (ECF subfamily)
MAQIPLTRASLLVRLRDPRNEAAWREFIDLYGPLVYSYLRKQGLQDADAADLGQEVLGAVAGAVGRLQYDPARGSFRSWLFTVVRRKLSNWRRSERNRPHRGNGIATQQLLEQYPAPADMEAQWQFEWERSLFAWACEQVHRDVTETTWQAFWRTAIDGQPSKQVASALGLTVAMVYVARSRVQTRLKELIQSVQEP